jgi:hypothetical protein
MAEFKAMIFVKYEMLPLDNSNSITLVFSNPSFPK